MKIFHHKSHKGYYTSGEVWLSIDPDLEMECIFLFLTIKNFKLLRDYFHSLPSEDRVNHQHLKIAFNEFRFGDSDQYGAIGLEIQNGTGNPEGLLIPLNSVKDGERLFTFDRIYQSENTNHVSKYSIDYCNRVYRFILMIDSLIISLSEKVAKRI